MPQAKFDVGESEKHEVLVQSSYWTGQIKVDVDGKRAIDSYTLGFPKTLDLDIGENEKHQIKIEVSENNQLDTLLNCTVLRKHSSFSARRKSIPHNLEVYSRELTSARDNVYENHYA